MPGRWRPDPAKRKGSLLDCGHYEAGGTEYQAGGRIFYECPHGCGERPRMSAAQVRERWPAHPDEPGF